ncbi:MAG: ATP-binding protein [Gloeotrichia echinulata GP01]
MTISRNNSFNFGKGLVTSVVLPNVLPSITMDLKNFLKIAIQLCEALGKLHQHNIIHKDIKPANIIINGTNEQVKIIDFSISSLLSREKPSINNPNLLEGTLAYISPEQTGRMNRSIDYRTDFYSLGVTFYQMLTGQLPHQATEAMELLHCHIAKQPLPPVALLSEIPPVVSQIVMKLLEKTAEDRYQSAFGIKADLVNCLTQLETSGTISDFPISSQDLSEKLQIPQKLYGREAEVTQLLTTFERVKQGTTELILIAGYSGIGKSALVNEIYQPIIKARGYFISGKFDQFKRNIPYAALVQAFSELMRYLLTETSDRLKIWKEKILDAVGVNGQVIIDVIPELELIIGQQPAVLQLGVKEAQNRFNLVFQKFISIFAQESHPLVLFLDDLQWADLASLKLIEILMSNGDRQYFLLIGAYRDNEVNATHPLMETVEQLQKLNAVVNTISLCSLSLIHVNQLIADTLNCRQEYSQSLAKLIFAKTDGNPFFVIQLFLAINQAEMLYFDHELGIFKWNIQLIQQMGITDNVVELMSSKIQKLSQSTQDVLKLAACIGNQFNL